MLPFSAIAQCAIRPRDPPANEHKNADLHKK